MSDPIDGAAEAVAEGINAPAPVKAPKSPVPAIDPAPPEPAPIEIAPVAEPRSDPSNDEAPPPASWF